MECSKATRSRRDVGLPGREYSHHMSLTAIAISTSSPLWATRNAKHIVSVAPNFLSQSLHSFKRSRASVDYFSCDAKRATSHTVRDPDRQHG